MCIYLGVVVCAPATAQKSLERAEYGLAVRRDVPPKNSTLSVCVQAYNFTLVEFYFSTLESFTCGVRVCYKTIFLLDLRNIIMTSTTLSCRLDYGR